MPVIFKQQNNVFTMFFGNSICTKLWGETDAGMIEETCSFEHEVKSTV